MKYVCYLLLLFPCVSFAQTDLVEIDDIVKGSVQQLEKKILDGANITTGFGKYNTMPLEIAVNRDRLDIVKLLLKYNGHKFKDRKYGFSRNFPNPLPATTKSFLFAQALRTTNPVVTVKTLLKYMDVNEYIDEILFYSINKYVKGKCESCLELSKDLIKLGAKPTTIFTIDEVGGISNAIYSTWAWPSWPKEHLTHERIQAHNILLQWVAKNEGLSKKEARKRYVSAMDNGSDLN